MKKIVGVLQSLLVMNIVVFLAFLVGLIIVLYDSTSNDDNHVLIFSSILVGVSLFVLLFFHKWLNRHRKIWYIFFVILVIGSLILMLDNLGYLKR